MKALFLTVVILLSGLTVFADENRVRVTPRETDELLANPGIGWQTFHTFADADRNLEGLPSTSAYFRFYWKEIEPKDGEIDFAKFDDLLAHAHKAGQKLAFRIMCAGTDTCYMHVPRWLRDKGCKGFEYRRSDSGGTHWVPDMDDPLFQQAHLLTIDRLGKRYEGHPDLDLVDIGSVGLWGEWHMSGTGVEMPSAEFRKRIIDAYLKAFPKTPKVMLIGDEDGMKYAVLNGCGWRGDCLGDMGGFSKTWNHMDNFYPQQVEKTGASKAWEKAPVAFESCWTMLKWKEENWCIPCIFDYGLNYHMSYLNNKSAKVPEGARPEIERLLRHIGYRFVLRSLEHDAKVSIGSPFVVSMTWENVGVAPPYRDYRVALRFTGETDKKRYVLVDKTSLKGWLPGKMEKKETWQLPKNLKRGNYRLEISIVDPSTSEPSVRLAIAGREKDGWYPLSQFEVNYK
jgi:hypothetical protein